MPETIPTALERLLEAARTARHRRLAVLSGTPSWSRRAARRFLSAHLHLEAAWIGEDAAAGLSAIPYPRAKVLVGAELDVLVYDAFSGFDPDAFGAVSGTVTGGGLILLLAPPLEAWPRHVDPAVERIALAGYPPDRSRLLERVSRLLAASDDAWLWREGAEPPPVQMPSPTPPKATRPADSDCLTKDQAAAVSALLRIWDDERGALVLTADRGRGKSAALGLAAGRLVRRDGARVTVTAPRRSAVEPVFRHARAALGLAPAAGGTIRKGRGELEYTAPDDLIRRPRRAELLLVDEAAGIPAPLLTSLLQRYPRVAFATTLHGYEGTGRGFAIRFRDSLDRLAPGWRQLTLTTPVRWAADDPVERLVARALLLDADAAEDRQVRACLDGRAAYRQLNRDSLAGDEGLLRQVFGLLVNAHYRTTPTDLRNLLDGPTVGVHVLQSGATVLAAAVTIDEGPFASALADAIWLGLRRPHGHLLPQSLCFHAGLREAAALRHRRVMRIAVHAAVRRRGYGSRLLGGIVAAAGEEVDTVGTSFGATADLLGFWRRAGFTLARIGIRREASSGTHAAMLVRGLSDPGRRLERAAARRLAADLPVLLAGPLSDVAAELRPHLPGGESTAAGTADSEDYLIAYGFAHGNRTLAACLAPLNRIARLQSGSLEGTERALLAHGCSTKPATADSLPRREADLRLREGFTRLLQECAAPACRAAEQEFDALRGRAESAAICDGYGCDDAGRIMGVPARPA